VEKTKGIASKQLADAASHKLFRFTENSFNNHIMFLTVSLNKLVNSLMKLPPGRRQLQNA
jgi:hypothetical protein